MQLLAELFIVAVLIFVLSLVAGLGYILLSLFAPDFIPLYRVILSAVVIFAAALVVGVFVYMRKR